MKAPVGLGGTTRTSAESALALLRAMMRAEPTETAVTIPAGLTVATALFVDVQLTAAEETGRPVSSLTETCSDRVAPGESSTTPGVMRTSFAPIGGVTVGLALSPQATNKQSKNERTAFFICVSHRSEESMEDG